MIFGLHQADCKYLILSACVLENYCTDDICTLPFLPDPKEGAEMGVGWEGLGEKSSYLYIYNNI